jgi:hypothetical protein
MNDASTAWRRWFGMLCLAVAAGMLIWGHTILLPYLEGTGFLTYWLVCFAFAIGSIIIALLDVHAILRNIRQERATLLRQAMQDIDQDAGAKNGQSRQSGLSAARGSRSFEEVQ